MIKLLAFDFDGTIADTLPVCVEIFREAVSPFAGHRLTDREISDTFGLNEGGMIGAIVQKEQKAALAEYHKLYKAMLPRHPEAFPGISTLLEELRDLGIPLALVTGKGRKSCKMSLQALGLDGLFKRVLCGAEDRPNKAASLQQLLDELELEPAEMFYVGDALSDVLACERAGIVCLSAAWAPGAGLEELREANPGHVFDTVDGLAAFLRTAI